MANGRMLSKDTPGDKKINQLSSDTSRLAFTWLIAFADCEGRTQGDPAMVCSLLFPRRRDVTIEQMEAMIREWAELGMIYWYEADGDKWIWFPNFEKHQPGLRKEKESPSRIPSHDRGTDLVRSKDGVIPPEIPDKGREVKLREEKGRESETPPPPPTEDFPDGDLVPYEKVFTEETKLPILSGGPERWFEGLKKIKECGASPEDFREAIREQTAAANSGKRYNLTSPASFVNATMNIVARKGARAPVQPNPADEALRRRQAALYGAQ